MKSLDEIAKNAELAKLNEVRKAKGCLRFGIILIIGIGIFIYFYSGNGNKEPNSKIKKSIQIDENSEDLAVFTLIIDKTKNIKNYIDFKAPGPWRFLVLVDTVVYDFLSLHIMDTLQFKIPNNGYHQVSIRAEDPFYFFNFKIDRNNPDNNTNKFVWDVTQHTEPKMYFYENDFKANMDFGSEKIYKPQLGHRFELINGDNFEFQELELNDFKGNFGKKVIRSDDKYAKKRYSVEGFVQETKFNLKLVLVRKGKRYFIDKNIDLGTPYFTKTKQVLSVNHIYLNDLIKNTNSKTFP